MTRQGTTNSNSTPFQIYSRISHARLFFTLQKRVFGALCAWHSIYVRTCISVRLARGIWRQNISAARFPVGKRHGHDLYRGLTAKRGSHWGKLSRWSKLVVATIYPSQFDASPISIPRSQHRRNTSVTIRNRGWKPTSGILAVL